MAINENEFKKIFTIVNPDINSLSIYFEKLSIDGLDEMHVYSVDKRLYEFFEFPPFKDILDTKMYIKKLLERMNDPNGNVNSQYWFVRNKSDNSLVGSAGLTSLDYSRKSIEWGYGIDPELWGKGYVLQIQEALKQYTFDVLELNRLHGITMVNNHRTIESVLASGMKHEGIARDYYCKDGVFVDGWTYAMTSNDFYTLNEISNKQKNPKIKEDEIISSIAKVLDSSNSLNIESSMENTPNWDSLTHMMLIVQLKEDFNINFSPTEIAEAISVRIIVDTIQKS